MEDKQDVSPIVGWRAPSKSHLSEEGLGWWKPDLHYENRDEDKEV